MYMHPNVLTWYKYNYLLLLPFRRRLGVEQAVVIFLIVNVGRVLSRAYFPQSRPRRVTPQLIVPLPLTRLGGRSGQRGRVPNPGGGLVSLRAPDNGWRWQGYTI